MRLGDNHIRGQGQIDNQTFPTAMTQECSEGRGNTAVTTVVPLGCPSMEYIKTTTSPLTLSSGSEQELGLLLDAG